MPSDRSLRGAAMWRLACVVVLWCGAWGQAAAEVLYERPVKEEEKGKLKEVCQYFFYGQHQEVTEDQIRTNCKGCAWEPQVVKVELLHLEKGDIKEGSLLQVGRPYVKLTYAPVVLHEREPTKEELERYDVSETLGSSGPRVTVDRTKKMILMRNIRGWPPDTLRIEIGYASNIVIDPVKRPYFCTQTSWRGLQGDRIAEKQVEEWKANAKAHMSVAKDIGTYKFQRTTWSRNKTMCEIYENPSRHYFSVMVGDLQGDRAEVIDGFVRDIVQSPCKTVALPFGTVVETKNKMRTTLHWISGEHLRIECMYSGDRPEEMVKTFFNKFPNNLPKDFEIDKRTWCRREMDRHLARVKTEIEQWWRNASVSFDARIVYVPFARGVLIGNDDPEAQSKMLQRLTDWWAKNKEATRWDERAQMLVAEGQSPAEVEAIAAPMRLQEEQERLIKLAKRTPLPPKETMRDELVEAMFDAVAMGDNRSVEPTDLKDDNGKTSQWELRYTNYNKKEEIYRLLAPEIEPRESVRYPYTGWFNCREIHSNEVRPSGYRFYFDRKDAKWEKGEPPE